MRTTGPDPQEPAFPPVSTSLPAFLADGTDREFRGLIYGLLQMSTLMLKTREHYGAHIGVSAPQYSILMAMAERGDTTVTELAEMLHVSGPFITVEINKLSKAGHVLRRRSPSDGRSSLLSLTASGKELIRRVSSVRARANDIAFGALSPMEGQILRRAVPKLIEGLLAALHDLEKPRSSP